MNRTANAYLRTPALIRDIEDRECDILDFNLHTITRETEKN